MPATTVQTEVIKDAVGLACRAPSLHNAQPWRWVLAGSNQLQLFLDSSRVTLSDRSGREALIGCGAALDHLRVAMAAAGWRTLVERFPNPNDPHYLASIRFAPMDYVTEGHRRRADAILLRRSDRLPFIAPMHWESFEPVLRNTLDGDAVHLDVLPDDLRTCLAEASQLADSLRLYDSGYHAELGWWTAPFAPSAGIPYSSLLSAAESDRVAVARGFPLPRHRERRTAVPEDNATILLLSTDTDDRTDAVLCGEALSAVLLDCTMAGLATCPVTHITEVRTTRDMIASCLDHDAMPQVLIRVGVAPAMDEVPPPTPRRPLDDVLRIQR
ncbi:Acg family FMN-binding oxidoreductase [Mycobacterium talmoniae]|uniref:NAD(P)H nitroreductase n=1 Tax=Mycobacterium talmoniae TaxID=1858794 RepID=A0A1S1NPA8_9MYCO|nr:MULTISPECIES: NAD(P)H nitroreductase [Mycobacterium]OHV06056.1 NAD(P)H nitroreductase [Mycobacterium talmoniae]PQM46910.1 Putative NAD(P)H nitroreductase acg [Mycobacterium talmoniae]TDH48042.1 NAD(P)H nitroreductase [Mycobacterium eburneum]